MNNKLWKYRCEKRYYRKYKFVVHSGRNVHGHTGQHPIVMCIPMNHDCMFYTPHKIMIKIINLFPIQD
jgi:hypothetical protein